MKINDGTGGGFQVKVDSNNRLHIDGVVRNEREQAALVGNCYNINTGPLTMTTANESAVFYIKYDDPFPLVIEEILIILGGTTNGVGDAEVEILKNPTAGTIISNAVPVDTAENRDFSSSKVIGADIYKGAEGYTLTDGTSFAKTTRNSFGTVILFDSAPIILRKGNALGIRYTPPAGNTSQSVTVALTCLEEESEV
jgi:hypothetical protein